jgi:hypothetical protein
MAASSGLGRQERKKPRASREGLDAGQALAQGRQDSARPTINHKLSRAVPSPNQLASCVIGNKQLTDGEHTRTPVVQYPLGWRRGQS